MTTDAQSCKICGAVVRPARAVKHARFHIIYNQHAPECALVVWNAAVADCDCALSQLNEDGSEKRDDTRA